MLVWWLLQGWMLHNLSSGFQLAHCGMVPVNCVCLRGHRRGSLKAPRRDSVVHGWRHRVCPADPPFETAVGVKRDRNSRYSADLQPHPTVTASTSEILKIEGEMRYRKTLRAPTSTTNKQEKEGIWRFCLR